METLCSPGSIAAKHGDYEDLFASQFNCNNASFDYVELKEHWTSIGTIDTLSMNSASFTTLR